MVSFWLLRFKYLCWGALQSPLFGLHVLLMLELSSIWRQNLRQIQTFENLLELFCVK